MALQWVFPLLAAVYAISAWNMVILDCDETYNYLEPLHHLIFGHGFQTWEYAPAFALRPYSFLALFSLPLRLLIKVLRIRNKVLVFKILRLGMGTMAAASQASFIQAISRALGRRTANYTALLLAASSGMFISSTAFLPNTFSMSLLCWTWSFWLRGHDNKVIMLTMLNFVIGWPYAILAAVIPSLVSFKTVTGGQDGRAIAVKDLSWRIRAELLIRRLFFGALFSLVYIVFPSCIVERTYYGVWTFPSLNALLYNLVSKAGGPALFGVEPWHYYLQNLALNFGPALVLALVPAVHSVKSALIWCNMAGLLALFSAQAHKEERFLFILYPLLCASSAMTLAMLRKIPYIGRTLTVVAIASSALFGTSRSYALVRFYSAPQRILSSWDQEAKGKVCMADSWYRFPGSFYLADGHRLGFVNREFDGQLPVYYRSGTDSAPARMNSLNKAIDEQFSSPADCEYFLGTEAESLFKKMAVVTWAELMNAPKTRAGFRWLWLPFLSNAKVGWEDYCLFKIYHE